MWNPSVYPGVSGLNGRYSDRPCKANALGQVSECPVGKLGISHLFLLSHLYYCLRESDNTRFKLQ
jgi:hypothetical protein